MTKGAVACALIGFLSASSIALAADAPHACNVPGDLARLTYPLPHLARHLAAGGPITIIAIGSSSTAGAGASSPAASYPSRLAVELSQRFPKTSIKVINRGVNGEEVPDMLARFDSQVAPEHPDLVLWQVGTNSVLRDHPLAPHQTLLHEGVERLKTFGADVVLIDPQYAPKVLAKSEIDGMLALIGTVAKRENVDQFHRFELMRKWHDAENLPFEAFVSPDGLHMNDWSYGCLAKVLSAAIAEAATRPVATVAAIPRAR
jgi:lysophospholipase L1-like esterase